MIDLVKAAKDEIEMNCAMCDAPLSHTQSNFVKIAIERVLEVAELSNADIVHIYMDGSMSQASACHWLGVDAEKLVAMANGDIAIIEDDDNNNL